MFVEKTNGNGMESQVGRVCSGEVLVRVYVYVTHHDKPWCVTGTSLEFLVRILLEFNVMRIMYQGN
jgi:hypothetical protein